jgi:hypothetical protein
LRLAAFTGAGLAAVFAVVFGAALPTATLLMTVFALSLRGALDTFFSVFAGFFISTRHRIKAKSYLHSLRTI